MPMVLIILIIIVVVLYLKAKGKLPDTDSGSGGEHADPGNVPSLPFPEGLDAHKVSTSFMAIQEAWQNKDLKNVRKWMSDGVYQRYTAQFSMMKKLDQVNKLSNIHIFDIKPVNSIHDGNYQSVDVAIAFRMDDEFLSQKFPQFNERFQGDEDSEYWTFIKRTDAAAGKNLYDNNNCPNCGAPLDIKLGEISRCSSCGTLTNNASFDWVLCEITQGDDYSPNSVNNDDELHQLTRNDKEFSVQRMEDIASNVFMQIMEVMTGSDDKALGRFADENTAAAILKLRSSQGHFIFDRLYLNDVSLTGYSTDNELLSLRFGMTVTYKRVQVNDNRLSLIDQDTVMRRYTLNLSKSLKALKTPAKETVYSHECSGCGAPYNDTTDKVCTYCGAPVVDLSANWVLTGFEFEG